jgi:hypothetical protein
MPRRACASTVSKCSDCDACRHLSVSAWSGRRRQGLHLAVYRSQRMRATRQARSTHVHTCRSSLPHSYAPPPSAPPALAHTELGDRAMQPHGVQYQPTHRPCNGPTVRLLKPSPASALPAGTAPQAWPRPAGLKYVPAPKPRPRALKALHRHIKRRSRPSAVRVRACAAESRQATHGRVGIGVGAQSAQHDPTDRDAAAQGRRARAVQPAQPVRPSRPSVRTSGPTSAKARALDVRRTARAARRAPPAHLPTHTLYGAALGPRAARLDCGTRVRAQAAAAACAVAGGPGHRPPERSAAAAAEGCAVPPLAQTVAAR